MTSSYDVSSMACTLGKHTVLIYCTTRMKDPVPEARSFLRHVVTRIKRQVALEKIRKDSML